MRNTILICMALILSGCVSSYPFGMNQSQWDALSPKQQQEAIAQQQKQDELARQQQAEALRIQQQHALLAQRQKLELAARERLGIADQEWAQLTPDTQMHFRQQQEELERTALKEQQRAAQMMEIEKQGQRQLLYINPIPGTVLECMISGGKAKFDNPALSRRYKWADIVPIYFSIARSDSKTILLEGYQKETYLSLPINVEFLINRELRFKGNMRPDYTIVDVQRYDESFTVPLRIPSILDGAKLSCNLPKFEQSDISSPTDLERLRAAIEKPSKPTEPNDLTMRGTVNTLRLAPNPPLSSPPSPGLIPPPATIIPAITPVIPPSLPVAAPTDTTPSDKPATVAPETQDAASNISSPTDQTNVTPAAAISESEQQSMPVTTESTKPSDEAKKREKENEKSLEHIKIK
jgi:hypothetical protein